MLNNVIAINVPKAEKNSMINNQEENWNFKFDKILHNVSQEEVFETCGKDVVRAAVEGYNGTIFAYGQTGSGKTFTISGSPNNYSYRGIIPRGINTLFQEIGNKPEFDFDVQMSYLEIYNESLFDLLSPVPTYQQRGDISIQEDLRGNLIVKGLSKHRVNNEEEAFNLVFEGEANRTISEHKLNSESTRSHCVFIVYIEMKSRIESSEKVTISRLNFVDLAGSERVKKTGSTGILLKEANYINRSLTFLEQVVVSLTKNQESKKKKTGHVPYRQSKLTHILKDSIGGNCKTVMIANIWPEYSLIDETLSTLHFAKSMMNVENETKINEKQDTEGLVRKYEKQIKMLEKELAMHNTLANRGRINYEPYNAQQQYAQQLLAKQFLRGEIEDLEFDSVNQAKELFNQCRILYQKLWNSTDHNHLDEKIGVVGKQSAIHENLMKQNSEHESGIGDLEEKASFSIGHANKNARPVNKLEASRDHNLTHHEQEQEVFEKMEETRQEFYANDESPDKNVAFKQFRGESEEAKSIEKEIEELNQNIMRMKEEARKCGDVVTEYKTKILSIKSDLDKKKETKINLGDDNMNLIDEEECLLIQQKKEAKLVYDENLHKYKQFKSEIDEDKNNLYNVNF